MILPLSLLFRLSVAAAPPCDLDTMTFQAGFTLPDRNYYIGDGDLIIPNIAVITQSRACNYAETFLLTVDGVQSSAIDSVTGDITWSDTASPSAAGNYKTLMFQAMAYDERDQVWVYTPVITFKITAKLGCLYTTFLPVYTSNSTSYYDMSVSYLGGTQVQTQNMKDSVSLAEGNLDGTTFCGARTTTLTGTHSYLTLSGNTLTAGSLLSSEIGAHSVSIKQCLVSHPTVCSATYTFNVVITACELTDLSTPAAQTGGSFLLEATITLSLPVYIQTPLCGYTQSDIVEVDNSATLSTFGVTVGTSIVITPITRSQVGPHNLTVTTTWPCTTTICTTARTYTIPYTVLDLCTSTVISTAGLFSEIATDVLSSATVLFTDFTDSVGVAKGDATYCRPISYTVTQPAILTLTTITSPKQLILTSGSFSDTTTYPYATTTGTITATLTNWAITGTHTFNVKISPCLVAGSFAIPDQNYIVGQSALETHFPTFTQHASCTTPLTYSLVYTSGSTMVTLTTASPSYLAFTFSESILSTQTNDRTLSSPVIFDYCATSVCCQSITDQFTMTLTDPCLTTTFVPNSLNDLQVYNQYSVTSESIELQDTVSLSFNHLDGYTFCGKTLSFKVEFNGVEVTASWVSLAANLITIAPPFGTTQGVYTILYTNTISTGVFLEQSFDVQVIDPCLSTLLQTNTLTNLAVNNQYSVSTQSLFVQDSASQLFGNLDGFTYCGSRTVTYSVTLNSGVVTPTFISYSSATGVMTIAPDYATTEGIYSITYKNTLSNGLELIQSFDVTVSDPCLYTTFSTDNNPQADLEVRNQYTVSTLSLATQDSKSFLFGNLDGYTYCGNNRTITYTVTLLGNTVSPSFMTYASNILTFAPLFGQAEGVYTIHYTNSLPNGEALTQSFKVTLIDPCLSTSLIDSPIATKVVSILTTDSASLQVKDSASNIYGNLDGLTYCGSRTVSYSVTFNGVATTTSWLTLSSNVLTIAPTVTVSTGDYTVSYTNALTSGVTRAQTFIVTVTPCQIVSGSWSSSPSNNVYTEYLDSPLTVTLPAFTQSPACGYAYTYSVVRPDSTLPSFVSVTSNTYTVQTTNLLDEGTHTVSAALSWPTYPTAFYSAPSFSTSTWSIQIINPCRASTLNPLSAFTAMTTTVLVGTPVVQNFAQSTDSISLLYDSNLVHYSYSGGLWVGPQKGADLCGLRSFSISSNCNTFLTTNQALQNQPYLSLTANLAAQVGTYTCTITERLSSYTQSVTETVAITINPCVIVSIDVATTSPGIVSYFLMGAAASVTFPTFVQTPLCEHTLTYSCSYGLNTAAPYSSIYPSGISTADPDNSPVANLGQIFTCDTTNQILSADITSHVSGITDLSSYQLQGDYGISVIGNYPGVTIKTNYNFILRVINPCKWKTFGSAYNSLVAPTMGTISAKVLASTTQDFIDFTDYASTTYSTTNDYQLCGLRTYTASPAYSWLTIDSTSINSNTISVYATSASDINYVGNTANPSMASCYTVTLIAKLQMFQMITSSTTVQVCIEECKPVSFTATFPYVSNKSYNIWQQSQLTVNFPGWSQGPLCGYSIAYSATIEKLSATTSVGSAAYPATALTSSSHSYIKYYNPSVVGGWGYLTVFSQNCPDNGVYRVIVQAVLQEFKYNQAINTNTQISFTVTLIDPCASTNLNEFAVNTANYRLLTDLAITVKGPSISQQFYQFMDSVSLTYDTAHTNPNSVLTGVSICGLRTYTFLTSYSWMTLDQVNGIIRVQTDSDADIGFTANGGKGYKQTMTACLASYPQFCVNQVFYVRIGECVILSLTADSVQTDVTHSIFAPTLTVPIITYTQTPLCGWSKTFTIVDSATSTIPSWITQDSTQSNWLIYSKQMTDANVYTLTQTVTLSNKILGVYQGTELSINFKVGLTDPCLSSQIVPQSGVGEAFDSSSNMASITTSVLYGIDLAATLGVGARVSYDFKKHDDTISLLYPTAGIDFVCGIRIYSVAVVKKSDGSTTYLGNFASTVDKSALVQSILVYTYSDLDIGMWQLRLSVSLQDYPSVPSIQENLWVEIESCIVNAIIKNNMSTANEALMTQFKDPSTPFSFYVNQKTPAELNVNTYKLQPNCSYPLYTQFNVLAYPAGITENNFLSALTYNINPKLKFMTSEAGLDQCTYGLYDAVTGTTDYSQCIDKNPYHVQYRVYIQNYNANSLQFENTQLDFYVWPRDPCFNATLVQDTFINSNKTITYFKGDSQLDVPFQYTNDSVSKNTSMLIPLGNNMERCGLRMYDVLLATNDELSQICTASGYNQVNLHIYTENSGFVGLQKQRLKSYLQDYPFVTAYAEFSVKVYELKALSAISLQYYQILSKKLLLLVPAFQVEPNDNTDFVVGYSFQVISPLGEVLVPTPSWLQFDTTKKILSVYSKDFKDIGNYTVSVIGTVSDKQKIYGVQTYNTFLLVIQKDPPPVTFVILPVFSAQLEMISVYVGDPLDYVLPMPFSGAGWQVKVSVLTQYPWLNYDPSQQRFTILSGVTKANQIGAHKVSIVLTDDIGSQNKYYLSIAIQAKPSLLTETQQSVVKKLSPVPSIKSISDLGLLTIKWDRRIKVPRNLTLIRNQNTTYYNMTSFQLLTVPSLDIQVLRGSNTSIDSDLSFNWKYKSWTATTIEIDLNFANPLNVSQTVPLESLQIIFYNAYNFVDQISNAPVLGGPDPQKGNVLKEQIPKQRLKVMPIPEEPIATGEVIGSIGQVIFQLLISYFLNSVWSMVSTQQLIVLLPCFKVQLPSNAGDFFAYLMTIASFDIIPTDPIFAFVLQTTPPDPLSENFGTVGFGTTYFFNNLGSLTLFLLSFPFQVVIAWVLKKFHSVKFLLRKGLKMERTMYWNDQIFIIQGSYVILCTCALIQFTSFEFDNGYGPFIMSVGAIVFFVECCVFPFWQFWLCWKNFDKLGERTFEKRFGALWADQRIEDRKFIWFNLFFLLRRLHLAMILVVFRDILIFQIAGLILQIIFAVIVAGATHPWRDNQQNKLEYFNEVMLLCCLYNIMCFTDFQPDADIQYQQGYVICFFVVFHIAFNLFLMLLNNLDHLKNRWKKYRMMRKYAKMRAEQHRRIEKKKRHAKWKKQTEKAIGPKLETIQEEHHEESYELKRVSENEIDIQSVEDSGNELEKNPVAVLNRVPNEAPEAVHIGVTEFEDGAGRTNQQLNDRLGIKTPVEQKPQFEKDVHKELGKGIPLDYFFADPLALLNENQPEEFKDAQLHMIGRAAPRDMFDSSKVVTEEMKVHNRIGRIAQQDVNPAAFKKAKVVPTRAVMRVQADTRAIHDRLFTLAEQGDGPKETSKHKLANKRKLIVPSPTEPPIAPIPKKRAFVIPMPRELQSLEDLEPKKTFVSTLPKPVPRETLQQDTLRHTKKDDSFEF